MTPQITPCTPTDLDKLTQQQQFAQQRLQMILGDGQFDGTEADLGLIQQALDSGELNHTVDLQCFGVPFGQLLINQNKQFDWWMFEDELGPTPCLRYRHSSLLIFPLTLISKRIELGERVEVSLLFDELHARIQPLCKQLDQDQNSGQVIH